MVKKTVSKPQNPDFKGFVNINLTEELKATIKAQPFSSDVFEKELYLLSEAGYRVNFSYDDYNHCYQSLMTPQQRDHNDFGIFLAGRGSSPAKAFKQMLYLFINICDRDLSAYLKPPEAGDYDD